LYRLYRFDRPAARILSLQRRAHSDHEEPQHALELTFDSDDDTDDDDGGGSDAQLDEVAAEDDDDDEANASAEAAEALKGLALSEDIDDDAVESSLRSGRGGGVNVLQHSRQFSTVCSTMLNQDDWPDSAATSGTQGSNIGSSPASSVTAALSPSSSMRRAASAHSLASAKSSVTSSSSSFFVPPSSLLTPSGSTRRHTADTAPSSAGAAAAAHAINPSRVRAHRELFASGAAFNNSSSASASLPAAPKAASPATRGHHHHHHSNGLGSGSGRNLSLDSSARALGLNVIYLERLALPLLRSEVHNFFAKLLSRAEVLLNNIQTDPVAALRRMQAGQRANATRTDDEELKRNFNAAAEQLQGQIVDILTADPAITDLPAAIAAATTTSASPPPPGSSPGACMSPPPAAASVAAAALSWPSSSSFTTPSWWPAALQASHASLVRAHGLFRMFALGFDDAASTTGTPTGGGAGAGGGRSSSSSVSGSFSSFSGAASGQGSLTFTPVKGSAASAAATPVATVGISTPGSWAKPPTHPPPSSSASSSSASTPSRRDSATGSLPLTRAALPLRALPTTHSNRDGLHLLARLMQSFSLVVALEGGDLTAATKLALTCQRLGNTLLERHRQEEPQWAAH
jgi:hypothetical protein